MINATDAVDDERLKVFEGIEIHGKVNTTDDVILSNVKHAIRLGHPQIRPFAPKSERVVLLGGGPSLAESEAAIRDLVFEGANLVTVNGAYRWAIDHNFRPQTQIVMDARSTNARFVDPAVPRCRYVLASQCHPETWAAVKGRPDVWIFHAATGSDGELTAALDTYYLGQWFGVGGGTTVVTRAISLLRSVGYLRFDLFGVDSCWLNGAHHAYEQSENAKDRAMTFRVHPTGHPELEREFTCSPWHVQQLMDLTQMIRINGDHFMLNVHGDGLLAYALRSSAACELVMEPTNANDPHDTAA